MKGRLPVDGFENENAHALSRTAECNQCPQKYKRKRQWIVCLGKACANVSGLKTEAGTARKDL